MKRFRPKRLRLMVKSPEIEHSDRDIDNTKSSRDVVSPLPTGANFTDEEMKKWDFLFDDLDINQTTPKYVASSSQALPVIVKPVPSITTRYPQSRTLPVIVDPVSSITIETPQIPGVPVIAKPVPLIITGTSQCPALPVIVDPLPSIPTETPQSPALPVIVEPLLSITESPRMSPSTLHNLQFLECPSITIPSPAEEIEIGQQETPSTPSISGTRPVLASSTPPMSEPSPISSDYDASESNTDTINTSSPSEPIKKKRTYMKRKDLGRNRHIFKTEWIDVKRKTQKNLGQCYVSRDGKEKPAKTLGPPCSCRLKCKDKIADDIRQKMFDQFWSLGDRVRQWEYITRWCNQITKRRITTEGDSKRNYTIRYYMPKTIQTMSELDANKMEKILVCKTMFLNTLSVGDGVIRTAIQKFVDGEGVVDEDQRGKHKNHPIVLTEEMKRSVLDHVGSFQPVESHYCRKGTSKLYLDGNLSFKQMFTFYNDWFDSNKYQTEHRATTLRQYEDIVNESIKLEFHRPKKDQCDVCESYKNLPKPVTEEDSCKQSVHLRNKDAARAQKLQDKLTALNSAEIMTAAFDLQKAHGVPQGNTGIYYYKRKLNVLNLTIFDLAKKQGYCYVWHEGIAKRGANEIGSCLLKFIEEHSKKGIRRFIFYSDNCGGQNRNKIIFSMFVYASQKFNVNIIHRFLEKGHTQNENDSVHSVIERSAVNKTIYVPEQWYALVRWAKENGEPYSVTEMTKEDFFDLKQLLIGKNWAKNDCNKKFYLSETRELKIDYTEPDTVYYKTDYDEPYMRLSTVSRISKRSKSGLEINFDLPLAYDSPIPINEAKYKDLLYFCDNYVIPAQYHAFYKSLPHGDVAGESEED